MQPITIQPSDLPVQWQGIAEHTTQRGRVKPVLTGIPGPLFWHHWKHHTELREKMRTAGIGLQKLAKSQWQVVIWINRHNRNLVETLGFTVPEVAKQEAQAF